MSLNERITESITRKLLSDKGYYLNPDITIEEQKTENKLINKLLAGGGKNKGSEEIEINKKGKARPEFIGLHKKDRSYVLLIECKANENKHKSDNLDSPVDYAVDGVLHYAKLLSKEFNVIAVGISGQKESSVKISNYIWAKGSEKPQELVGKDTGKPFNELLSFEEYKINANYHPEVAESKLKELIKFSQELHQYIYDVAKLSEADKPLLVSGVLIALQDPAFRKVYKEIETTKIGTFLLETIERRFKSELPDNPSLVKKIVHEYKNLEHHPNLNTVISQNEKTNKESPMEHIVDLLNENVYPFIDAYHRIDVLGEFYTEFLSYVGGDKKGLGIVLTPHHIKELFCHIAQLTPKDRIADTCMGTAGFLIAGMDYMIKHAKNEKEGVSLKNTGFFGIEQEPKMFTLSASNMLLRGYSIKNMHQGSCFSSDNRAALKKYSPTACLLNPPYAQKGEGLSELDFVYDACELSADKAIIVAIVPMSCAIGTNKIKEKILSKHRLLAVMSMPDDLFYPVGTVTCIMVFEAHVAHNSNSQHKTWFGYWKKDGFVKTKNRGRQDVNKTWDKIKNSWLEGFLNKKEEAGLSVLKKVTGNDEWCAEAYMETDYTAISDDIFKEAIKKYAVFKSINKDLFERKHESPVKEEGEENSKEDEDEVS